MAENLEKLSFVDSDLPDRLAVYDFIAQSLSYSYPDKITAALIAREEQASIQIWPGVVLPHFELADLSHSSLVLIRLRHSISWNDAVGRVKLIICLALKSEDSLANKTIIRNLMAKLANEAFIDYLLTADPQDFKF